MEFSLSPTFNECFEEHFCGLEEKKNSNKNFEQKLSDNKNLLKMAYLTRIKLQTKAYD